MSSPVEKIKIVFLLPLPIIARRRWFQTVKHGISFSVSAVDARFRRYDVTMDSNKCVAEKIAQRDEEMRAKGRSLQYETTHRDRII